MLFDIVIGNPPFNIASDSDKTKCGTSGYTAFYKRFVDLAFRIRKPEGIVAMVVQRNGVKYAMDRFGVSLVDMDLSAYWHYNTGYFVSIGDDDRCIDVTENPIIHKCYAVKTQRQFRWCTNGSYKVFVEQGCYSDTEVPGSVYGLIDVPKKDRGELYGWITVPAIPAGPKVVFSALTGPAVATDLPSKVGSSAVMFFDTLDEAERARLFINNSPIVKYLRKHLKEKSFGCVFRYMKEFDLNQIVTGFEIPVEYKLTEEEVDTLTSKKEKK